MNLTDFSGQRPWVALNCFACEARPTPPEKRRKGMTCICSLTSPRYLYALSSFKPVGFRISHEQLLTSVHGGIESDGEQIVF